MCKAIVILSYFASQFVAQRCRRSVGKGIKKVRQIGVEKAW